MLPASNRVLMTACATIMECFFRLCRFFGFMLMAFVTGLHHGISRQAFMMTCCTLRNTESSVHFVGKSNNTIAVVKSNANASTPRLIVGSPIPITPLTAPARMKLKAIKLIEVKSKIIESFAGLFHQFGFGINYFLREPRG